MADAVLVGTRGSATGNLTTGAGTSTASGSTFVIALSYDGGATLDSVSDSKGNTYTLIDSQASASIVALYYCQNGTGGSNHTASANFTGSSFGSIYLIELTGVLTSGVLDKANKGGTSSPPISLALPSAGLFSQADEVIVAIQGSGVGSADYTSSNMTRIDQETDGGSFWTSGIFKLVIASTSAVTLNLAGGDSNSIAVAASFKASASGSSTTVTPAQAALALNGRTPATSAFTNVRIREVLVNASGQAVGSASDIGLRVWYSGICAGPPDVSLNGLTTDANGTTSWSIATGTLGVNQPIFFVAQNSVSYSHYCCGRIVPSYE